MAIQTVNIGTSVNDGTGDPTRTAFNKINQNFTDASNAASRIVGTAAGNVMEVGAFGLGRVATEDDSSAKKNSTGFYNIGAVSGADTSGQIKNFAGVTVVWNTNPNVMVQFGANVIDADPAVFGFRRWTNSGWGTFYRLYGTHNVTKDTSNGYLKGSSPIVKLYFDRIELNDDAKKQNITFEKLGIGDYLIKGSLGFAQEGWYIETPKDANGNVLVAVVYEQLANNHISVKTYAKKLDPETGDVIANLSKPVDIPPTRWIDLRLHEIKTETAPVE